MWHLHVQIKLLLFLSALTKLFLLHMAIFRQTPATINLPMITTGLVSRQQHPFRIFIKTDAVL
jgi:hypothetical protein